MFPDSRLFILAFWLLTFVAGSSFADESESSVALEAEAEGMTSAERNASGKPLQKLENHPLIEKFHARWWNHEKRGYLYLNHQQPQKALEDFEQAIRLRPSDSWRARTYGLHFEEYFPNRGKGIAHLALRQYDRARASLQQSLDDAPSEKALYFLKKVELDQRMDSAEDKSPPVIEVIMKSTPGRFRTAFSLQGLVSDDGSLTSISVAGKELELPPLCAEHQLSLPLEGLPDGYQTIPITAKDASGKFSQLDVPVLIDTSGPSVTLKAVRKEGSTLFVEGSLRDPSGLGLLQLGDQELDLKGAKIHNFEISSRLSAFTSLATLVSLDRIGNQSHTVLPIMVGEIR